MMTMPRSLTIYNQRSESGYVKKFYIPMIDALLLRLTNELSIIVYFGDSKKNIFMTIHYID